MLYDLTSWTIEFYVWLKGERGEKGKNEKKKKKKKKKQEIVSETL